MAAVASPQNKTPPPQNLTTTTTQSKKMYKKMYQKLQFYRKFLHNFWKRTLHCLTLIDLWLNSQSPAGGVNLIQMEKIKFSCQLRSFQEDSGKVEVEEIDIVPDAKFKLAFWDYLQ